jgi:hypothetical protein
MIDIMIINTIATICYPFIALYVWYKVKKSEAAKEAKAVARDQRINGRMDELIAAERRIAYEEGRKVGMAEGILIGQRG